MVGGTANIIVESCYNIGKVTNLNRNCGGLIGQGSLTAINKGKIACLTIKNCYNAGELCGKSNPGGILGGLGQQVSGYPTINATVNNCYNMGSVKSITTNIKTSGIMNFGSTVTTYISSCYYEIGSADYGVNGNSNSGCTSTTRDDIMSKIENLNDFVEDTQGINNGYPIFAWQVEKE